MSMLRNLSYALWLICTTSLNKATTASAYAMNAAIVKNVTTKATPVKHRKNISVDLIAEHLMTKENTHEP